MQLIEATNREDWERFQVRQPWAQFTQSWVWGEFRIRRGCPVVRFALTDDDGKWLCAVQGEYRHKRLGLGYWFAARGPVFDVSVDSDDYRKITEELLRSIYGSVKIPRCLFWRMEPVIRHESGVRHLPTRMQRTVSLNPPCTLLLDLTQSEEALLAGMHPKTRYNIKVATKHGIKTRTTSHPADLDKFLTLMRETAMRDKFTQHDDSHLIKTFQTLAAAGMARLRVAELNGAMLAANLETVYGDTATYLYGASSHMMRNVMAPYLLQWDAIRAAKQEGYLRYDFWGLNPDRLSSVFYKSTWDGITRFKLGWGGERVELLGTWDLPLNLTLYRIAFFRRLMGPI